MSHSGYSVFVAIPTFGRPVYFRRCLESVLVLVAPEKASLNILVIDNNPNGEEQGLVESLAAKARLPCFYRGEKERGIVAARNRALEEAIKLGATHLAFLDDDEFVEPDWLLHLWGGLQRYRCDVSIGPVSRIFESQDSHWIHKALPFVREYAGASFPCTKLPATNNVLLRLDLVKHYHLRFDPAYCRSGGSDSKFFEEVLLHGGSVAWVEEARVVEQIPDSRAQLGWVLRRCFRYGLNHTRRNRERNSLVFALCKTVPQAVLNSMFCILSLLFGLMREPKYFLDALCRLAISLGVLAQYLGFQRDEYNEIHGK